MILVPALAGVARDQRRFHPIRIVAFNTAEGWSRVDGGKSE
jgi:hypothetical protein